MQLPQYKDPCSRGVSGARLFRNLTSKFQTLPASLSQRSAEGRKKFRLCISQSSVVEEGIKGKARNEKPPVRERQRGSQPASRGRRGGLQGRKTSDSDELYTGPLRLNKVL